ncbi:AAA family ATPase [Sphingobacterium phlebotomi]|uniref:AAA family ATPase n=1 Tax=Sphingobacterium phlebotomi TaxID=2605433 RepID=A0A5D4GT08_9SPHI|nr:AAA family ATPase [Sphingobacterium phlebotomi]TYR31254.1 AAA family ATPase [Sphingobacterium phlebotomi]
MNKFARGSEWNKWDLHVHTPKSIIQHYGGDTHEAWEKYISDLEALPKEFKALGINDYIFIDGYKTVKEYKKQGRLANIDLILPIIELRIDKFASQANEAWKKVNLHVIFSDNLDVDDIQVQFLYAINSKTTIYPTGEQLSGVVTERFLEQLGNQIIETIDKPINKSAKTIGFENLVFDYEKIQEALKSSCFEGKYLTAVGKSEWDKMRWDGSAASKRTIVNNADFLFHALIRPEDHVTHVDYLRNNKVNDKLLDCSDAHSYSERKTEKDRIGNSFTWLKADLTFEGLKQVANDKTRIFIGDTPPLLDRRKNSPTKFIDSLSIKKIENSGLAEKWFENFQVELNPSMVAIIGNKGQGKSAIADVIGLLGNTRNYADFSFLERKKFRKPKPNRAESFSGDLKWGDGTTDSSLLDDNPEETAVEKVKYLPQSFIEKLCNEDLKDFEGELRNVIFSHLSDSDKLGKHNLDELVEFHSEIINDDIEEIKGKLQNVNKEIIELEKKNSESYRKAIEERIKEKDNELMAHDAAKPTPVEAPTDETAIEKNKEITERISAIRDQIPAFDGEIDKAQKSLANTKIDIAEVEKVIQSIGSFERQFGNLKTEVQPTFDKHSLILNDSISLTVNKEPLAHLLRSKQDQSIALNRSITNEEKTGFLDRREALDQELHHLQEKLDEQSRAYQKFLDAKKTWEEKRELIIGDEDKDGSIAALKAQISYIEDRLTADLDKAKESRKALTTELFKKKEEIITLYKRLFEPITAFIRNFGTLLSDYSIELDVDLKIVGLVEKFFDHVSLGSKGSFIGSPTGVEKLHQIIEDHELKSSVGLIAFLDEIILNLHTDQREDQKQAKREIEAQLKKGYSVLDLYTYLFNLDYLEPEYKLKLGEKNLSELSPGERGALLLIFYLTLDQNDIPLVIDQPEENLDNQSVFKILVQFIKRAKEKRQIIIVTHNPNLAVACNAEQIVHVSMDKEDGNKISFISGSLENPAINNAVINILEGTYPALNTRTNTYGVITRTFKEMTE